MVNALDSRPKVTLISHAGHAHQQIPFRSFRLRLQVLLWIRLLSFSAISVAVYEFVLIDLSRE